MLTPKSGPVYATEHVFLLDMLLLRTQLANMKTAASIPVRSLSSTVGTVCTLARAFRPIIVCAPTLWKSGIDAAYLADPQV